MKRFIVSLLALGLVLFASDRGVGYVLARLFRTSPSDDADMLGRGIASAGDRWPSQARVAGAMRGAARSGRGSAAGLGGGMFGAGAGGARSAPGGGGCCV